LRADIDYAHEEALTKVGMIGVKVWIMKGEVYEKRDLAPNFQQASQNNQRRQDSFGRNDRRRRNNRKPNR